MSCCPGCEGQNPGEKAVGKQSRRPRGQDTDSEMHQLPTHTGVPLGFNVGADAGSNVFGHTPLMDRVLADW